MPVELLLPRVKVPVLPMPSYVKLAMAFGVGAGASLFDKSRYRSHGAITTATWAAGLHGYCLDFVPGNPDYVTIPAAHTQLDFTAEDFSLIGRFYIDSLAADRQLFSRGRWKINGYHCKVSATGVLQVYTSQAAVTQFTTSAAGAITIGSWLTIGFSRAGAAITLFRNGVDITGVPGVHINPLTSNYSPHIGIYYDSITEPYDGKIEFLRIFGGIALSTSEHLAWHNALA